MVRAVRLVVLMFTLVVALDKLGFQVAPLVAGIGVGIALQGVLSNMVAGLSIILTKPFRVGEWISIVGVYGQVSAIELFSTTLAHPDPAWSFPTARSSARSCTTTARSDSSI
jgi:small conductance mechanosensitive channel